MPHPQESQDLHELKAAAAELAAILVKARSSQTKQANEITDALQAAYNNPAIYNTALGGAIGAGVGGVGGLIAGHADKNRKNPWSTALSGALGGTAVGMGLGGLYSLRQHQQAGPSPAAEADAAHLAGKEISLGNPRGAIQTGIEETSKAFPQTTMVGGATAAGLGAHALQRWRGNALGAGLAAAKADAGLVTRAGLNPAQLHIADTIVKRTALSGVSKNPIKQWLFEDTLRRQAQNNLIAGPYSSAVVKKLRDLAPKPTLGALSKGLAGGALKTLGAAAGVPVAAKWLWDTGAGGAQMLRDALVPKMPTGF